MERHPAKERHRPYDVTEPAIFSDVIAELFSRRGYGRSQSDQQLQSLWKELAEAIGGEHLARSTSVMSLRNRVLHISVDNAATMGELTGFLKPELLQQLQTTQPHLRVRDLKFKLRGRLDSLPG